MKHEIELAGNPVTVDVAMDDQSRYQGLSQKDDLGPDEGMLFVWPTEKEHGLVMRDMNFGLDMVFADADGKVTKVHTTGPDGDGASAVSKYAVELPRGWCAKRAIQHGDMLDLNEDGFAKSDTPTDTPDTLKDEIAAEFLSRADMDMGMFAALASETSDPEREEVDAPYNEVDGECPDGSTKAKLMKGVEDLFRKEWIPYVGPQGGEGWQEAQSGEVRYQQDPPGEVHGDYSDDYWSRHDGDSYPEAERRPDDPDEGVAVTAFTDEIPDLDVQETSAEDFVSGVEKKIEEDPEMGAFLTAHDPDEMEDHTMLRVQGDGVDAGVSVSPEGDVQNLFKIEGPSGTGRRLLEDAIDKGGRTLDCYAGYLNRAYRQHGFREVARQEFNPDFAPDDWNFEKYGQPDVVFMSYDPEAEPGRTANYEDDWGRAKELSRERANMDDRGEDMEEKQSEIRIPEDEEAVEELVSEDSDEELSDEQRNLALAQARLIGDL